MRSKFSARSCLVPFSGAAPAFAVFMSLLAVHVFAADVTSTWGSATSGNWNVNANWTNVPALGGFPNNGNAGVNTYDAVISAAGAPYTVTLNANVTVEDLLLNSASATLNHTTGTFTATGVINLTVGTYQLNGGTISNTTISSQAGALAVAATNANLLSGVTINGDLMLNIASGRTKLAGGTTFATAHLSENSVGVGFAPSQTLAGTILFEGPSPGDRAVEMDGTAGMFTVGPTGVMRTAAGLGSNVRIGHGTWWFGGAMTLVNEGLISSQTSGRTMTIGAPMLTNNATGILEAANGGILTINSTNWSSTGTLRALGGSMANLNGTWSNLGGTITADATSTLNLGGSFSTANLGTLNLAAGSRVNVVGAWNNSGQSFTFNNATGSWTLNGGSISGGSISFADGQTLHVGTINANLLSGVTINGDLTLSVNDGRTKLAAGTTFSTAHLAATNVGVGFAPGQTLTGTILFEGAGAGDRAVELDGTAGTFTVGPTGVIRTAAGLGSNARIGGTWWYGGAMTLVNEGLISSQTNGRTVTIHAPTLTNNASGVLEAANGGILTINSTNWSSAGTLRALGGSTANLTGTWSNLGGTITADATSTLNFGGSFSTANLGTLSLAAGSKVNVPGTWNNSGQSFTFNNATGSWTLNGGSITGGSINFAGGQTLLIANTNANLISGVTINGDLTLNVSDGRTRLAGGTTFTTAHLAATNAGLGFAPGHTLNGTILFEGAAAGDRAVEMDGTAGSFTVGPTAVMRTVAGLGSNVRIGGGTWWYGGAMTLANEGLISSQTSGRTVTIGASSVSNTGTLEAINGGSLAVTAGYTQTAGVTRLSGGGTLSASPNASVLNNITITGGRLEGSGTIMANVTNSATTAISPGTPSGTMAITGDLTLASTSILQLELGGPNQGVDFDFLSEGGTTPLNLAGALNITLLNGYVPAPADPLVIVSSNEPITGMFSNVVGGQVLASDGVTSLRLAVIGNHVVISGLIGDYNHDGIVDAADYVVWRKTLGQSGTNLAADGNHNNQVDADDYAIWRAQFGATSSGSGVALTNVPEPTTWVLIETILLVTAAYSTRRRQWHGQAARHVRKGIGYKCLVTDWHFSKSDSRISMPRASV